MPGHWEGDLLLGGTGKGAVITPVERSSRFVLLAPLPGRHTAEIARMKLGEMIATLPLELRKSVTWDRGSEMAQHARFRTETGMPIFFCDPQSPLAAGDEREHQRPAASVLAQGRGPASPHRHRLRLRRLEAQHAPPQDPGMADSRPGPQPEARCNSRLSPRSIPLSYP